MLRRAADGRGDELSLAEIDDEARPDGHVQNALDQGAGGRQVADDDGIAVVVVDRADLAEQRETVVALPRGAPRRDRPRPRRGMRAEERRGGKGCVMTCRSGGAPEHKKKKK